MIDIDREIKIAVNTGKVRFGLAEAKKAIKRGEARLLIVARNCPEDIKRMKGVKVYKYSGTNKELGTACGKPFAISVVTILEGGESKILSVGE